MSRNILKIATIGMGLVAIVVVLAFYASNQKTIFRTLDVIQNGMIRERLHGNLSSFAISQEKTACFGSCPTYRVEIEGDGTVKNDGGLYVDPSGKRTLAISNATVDKLVDDLNRMSFLTLEDSYGTLGTDAPSTIISVHGAGKELKRVVFGYNAPEQLISFTTKIEKIVGIEIKTE